MDQEPRSQRDERGHILNELPNRQSRFHRWLRVPVQEVFRRCNRQRHRQEPVLISCRKSSRRSVSLRTAQQPTRSPQVY